VETDQPPVRVRRAQVLRRTVPRTVPTGLPPRSNAPPVTLRSPGISRAQTLSISA